MEVLRPRVGGPQAERPRSRTRWLEYRAAAVVFIIGAPARRQAVGVVRRGDRGGARRTWGGSCRSCWRRGPADDTCRLRDLTYRAAADYSTRCKAVALYIWSNSAGAGDGRCSRCKAGARRSWMTRPFGGKGCGPCPKIVPACVPGTTAAQLIASACTMGVSVRRPQCGGGSHCVHGRTSALAIQVADQTRDGDGRTGPGGGRGSGGRHCLWQQQEGRGLPAGSATHEHRASGA